MRAIWVAVLLSAAPVSAQDPAVPSAEARLKTLYEADWQWRLREFVQVEDGLRTKDGDRFADVSAAAWARRGDYWRKLVAEIDAIPAAGLGSEARINIAVLREQARAQAAQAKWRTFEAPLNSDTFFWGEVKPYGALETQADYRRYLARLADVPRFFDQNLANMAAGLARGFTPPAVALKGRDTTIEPFTRTGPQNPLFEPFAAMPESIPAPVRAELAAEAARIIDGTAVPSYTKVLAYLRGTYLPAARKTIAARDLPQGREFYADMVREYTTTALTPAEIHAIGLKEVARIDADMRATIATTGFKGSFADFLAFLRSDPQFYARTPRELLGFSAYVMKRMDGRLKDVFTVLPRYRFTLRPVPDAIAPIYTSGRGGLQACLMNTYDLKSRPLYNLTALTLHECAPGHSHQAAVALEAPDRPKFRREAYFSGYGEGWGLYSEWLGTKLGLYETPYEEFGRETFENWRAARLVIDTGLHEMGWSRAQAIEYLADHTALARHDIEIEVDRYISWPGQALAYKLGEMQIRALRALAERELGRKFDQRPFHDALLALGSVPLPVLESEMTAWIAREKARTASR